MKKLFTFVCLWAMSCVAFSAMAQGLNGNIYTIHCQTVRDGSPVGYMQDNKSDDNRIEIYDLNDASYWRFISSGNEDCYYIKNVATGRYIQGYTVDSEMVTVGNKRVEYYVKASASYAGAYGMSCTANTPHDFTSGTLGLNLKGESDEEDCYAQSYAAVDGSNPRSFWILEGGTPYIGVAPGNYDEIYLYNVGTGTWFSNNDHNSTPGYWSSYSELNTRGRDLQMISENGGYRFNPKQGGSHSLRCDLWLDTSDTSAYDWKLALVDGTTDQYTLIGDTPSEWGGGSNTYQLGANSSGTITNSLNPTYGNWQLVTRESRIAYAKDMATEDNPVDMSWIVLGATFPTNDEHLEVWGDWTYYKSKNTGCWYSIWGDGIINCNMVFEIGDNNNGALYQEINDMPNGSYVVNADAIYSSATQDLINVNRYNGWLDGSEPNCGYIFANDKQVGVADIYDYVTTEQTTYNNLNLGNGYWTFNYTQSFSAYIFDGVAQTEDINLDITDNHLTIGARVIDGPDECWLCVDNFRVYYYGGEEENDEGGTGDYTLTFVPADNAELDKLDELTIYCEGGMVLNSETGNNAIDFHIYDAEGNEINEQMMFDWYYDDNKEDGTIDDNGNYTSITLHILSWETWDYVTITDPGTYIVKLAGDTPIHLANGELVEEITLHYTIPAAEPADYTLTFTPVEGQVDELSKLTIACEGGMRHFNSKEADGAELIATVTDADGATLGYFDFWWGSVDPFENNDDNCCISLTMSLYEDLSEWEVKTITEPGTYYVTIEAGDITFGDGSVNEKIVLEYVIEDNDADLYARLCSEIEGLSSYLAETWATIEAEFAADGTEIPTSLTNAKESIELDIEDVQTKTDNCYAEGTLAANEEDIKADITAIQEAIAALQATATGIEELGVGESTTTTVYTISGQKVNAPTSKGIYIINGKKVVVK